MGVAYAQGQGAVASGGWLGLVPIILMFVIFYFILIRPQQKKEKQRRNMIDNLQKGDKIMVGGGMYGVVTGIKDDIVSVKIATNTTVEFSKNAVQAKIS